jgi:ubiquitin carboxyl-terminal hydrolase 10
MCFANVALQLLVCCPQFWNQLRYMSRLIGQRGEPKGQPTGGARTVLVDATFRLLDEFVHKEKKSLTQRSLQLAQKGKVIEDEMEKKEDNDMDPFIPMYVYDAMKEKKQFKGLLVRTRAHIVRFCY